ncbi:MAG TPA: motility-associated protein [Candidatus Sulfotelmatobacter sp.]
MIIIGGASMGTLLVANPLHILQKIGGGIGGVCGGSKFGKQTYIDTLKMMYDLLNKARKDGLMALEVDVREVLANLLRQRFAKITCLWAQRRQVSQIGN